MQLAPGPGHPEQCHDVKETSRLSENSMQPIFRDGGCDHKDRVDFVLPARLQKKPCFLDGKIRGKNAVQAGGLCLPAEAVEPSLKDEIVIDKQTDRHIRKGSNLPDELKTEIHTHSCLQSTKVRSLDGRAVRNGVRKADAQLQHVRPPSQRCFHRLE